MKLCFAALIASYALTTSAIAASQSGVDEETVQRIMAMLAEMNCQMAPDDIEMEDEGYELDDVICEGGQ